MIALGCDHGGYNLICAIKKYLDEKGLEYKEYGTFSEESVDYPVYAYKVATAITSGECSTGILCCGTGIGTSKKDISLLALCFQKFRLLLNLLNQNQDALRSLRCWRKQKTVSRARPVPISI